MLLLEEEEEEEVGRAGGGIAMESATSRADRSGAGELRALKEEGAVDLVRVDPSAPVTMTAGGGA